MSARRFEDVETDVEVANHNQEPVIESSPSTKLERRRRIEEFAEEKRLQQEISDYDFI